MCPSPPPSPHNHKSHHWMIHLLPSRKLIFMDWKLADKTLVGSSTREKFSEKKNKLIIIIFHQQLPSTYFIHAFYDEWRLDTVFPPPPQLPVFTSLVTLQVFSVRKLPILFLPVRRLSCCIFSILFPDMQICTGVYIYSLVPRIHISQHLTFPTKCNKLVNEDKIFMPV